MGGLRVMMEAEEWHGGLGLGKWLNWKGIRIEQK